MTLRTASGTRAAHGAVEATRLGNGLWEHTSFNARLQPEEDGLGASAADSSVLRLSYGYGGTDNNGDVRSQRIRVAGTLDLTQSYEYDAVNRLLSAREAQTGGGADAWRQSYTYSDSAGQNSQFGNRRVDASVDPATGQARTTANAAPQSNPQISPATNRFDEGQGYVYDGAGNLRQDPSHSYGYDGENRLAAADGGWNGTGGANYSYDGEGHRVKKVTGAEATVFVYDAAGKLVAEYSNQIQANGTSYLTQDSLGSARAVTDKDGVVRARHDYLPFGEEIGAGVGGRTQGYSHDGVRQKFTGYERGDETGLDYAHARYYSSAQGRFTSPDNFLNDTSAIDPASWNLYSYVRNNPLRYTDPSGEKIYVGGLGQADRDELLKRTNYTYGCQSCVSVDKNGYLTVDTGGLSKDLLKATQFLTDAINTTKWYGEVRVSNNDPDVAFGEGRRIQGAAPFEDGSGRRRNADLIVLDFGDDQWVSGDSRARDAFLNTVFAHEVAHFRLQPGQLTRDPDDVSKTGPVVDAINEILQARGLSLRARYSSSARGGYWLEIYHGIAERDRAGGILPNRDGGIKVKINETGNVIRWLKRNVGGKGIN